MSDDCKVEPREFSSLASHSNRSLFINCAASTMIAVYDTMMIELTNKHTRIRSLGEEKTPKLSQPIWSLPPAARQPATRTHHLSSPTSPVVVLFSLEKSFHLNKNQTVQKNHGYHQKVDSLQTTKKKRTTFERSE